MRAFIAIGSNLGDRTGNVREAVRLVADGVKASLVAMSSLYETEPWGVKEQGPFVNAAMIVETPLAPSELLAHLKSVEASMGRTRTVRWGPRTIDLDIIFIEEMVIEAEGLRVPHPGADERAFVMVPLAEIAPDFVHPVTGATLAGIAGGLDKSGVKKME